MRLSCRIKDRNGNILFKSDLALLDSKITDRYTNEWKIRRL